MKLVTMILTAMSLAACNVKGPEDGEVKVNLNPKSPHPKMNPLDGEILVITALLRDEDGNLKWFALELDYHSGGEISIREVDSSQSKDGPWKPEPNWNNKCIDNYTQLKQKPIKGGTMVTSKKGAQMYIELEVKYNEITGKYEITNIVYTKTDSKGKTQSYDQPDHIEDQAHDFDWQNVFQEVGMDCDHVSQSGEEEGSAAQ